MEDRKTGKMEKRKKKKTPKPKKKLTKREMRRRISEMTSESLRATVARGKKCPHFSSFHINGTWGVVGDSESIKDEDKSKYAQIKKVIKKPGEADKVVKEFWGESTPPTTDGDPRCLLAEYYLGWKTKLFKPKDVREICPFFDPNFLGPHGVKLTTNCVYHGNYAPETLASLSGQEADHTSIMWDHIIRAAARAKGEEEIEETEFIEKQNEMINDHLGISAESGRYEEMLQYIKMKDYQNRKEYLEKITGLIRGRLKSNILWWGDIESKIKNLQEEKNTPRVNYIASYLEKRVEEVHRERKRVIPPKAPENHKDFKKGLDGIYNGVLEKLEDDPLALESNIREYIQKELKNVS